MGLELAVSDAGQGCTVIRAVGEILRGSTIVFEEKVEEVLRTKPKIILFDLTEVPEISSAAAGVLIGCAADRRGLGTKIVIVGAQGATRMVLEMLGLLAIVPHGETMEEGLKLVGKAVRGGG